MLEYPEHNTAKKKTDYKLILHVNQHTNVPATVEFQIFEPPRKTKIGSKNRIVWEIWGKLQCLTEEREMNFGLSYWELRKKWRFNIILSLD